MSKISFRIGNAAIEFEGEEDFIKNDLMRLFLEFASHPEPLTALEGTSGEAENTAKQKKIRAKRGAQGSSSAAVSKAPQNTYKPKLNSSLDLGKLEEFFDKYELNNHPDKILAFGIFLRDVLGKQSLTADDVFSCYFTLKSKTKIPEAFAKSLRDARNAGFIDFEDPFNISISVAGQNAFQKVKSKESSA